jgi:hypothetical protein
MRVRSWAGCGHVGAGGRRLDFAFRSGASLPVRTARIAAELGTLAGKIAEDHRHEIESAVSRAGSASFDEEDHGVMAAVDACRQIAESAAVVGAASKAARALAEIEVRGSAEVGHRCSIIWPASTWPRSRTCPGPR